MNVWLTCILILFFYSFFILFFFFFLIFCRVTYNRFSFRGSFFVLSFLRIMSYYVFLILYKPIIFFNQFKTFLRI